MLFNEGNKPFSAKKFDYVLKNFFERILDFSLLQKRHLTAVNKHI